MAAVAVAAAAAAAAAAGVDGSDILPSRERGTFPGGDDAAAAAEVRIEAGIAAAAGTGERDANGEACDDGGGCTADDEGVTASFAEAGRTTGEAAGGIAVKGWWWWSASLTVNVIDGC